MVAAAFILSALVALIVTLPATHETAETVTRRLCRSGNVATMLAPLRADPGRDRTHYARAVAAAVIAIETYNRPAAWREAENIVFAVLAWASPRVARMTLGPAQISRAFFEREIAPLAPAATFPASIATFDGARAALEVWAAARLPQVPPYSSASAPGVPFSAVAELFETFHGRDDGTYRRVAFRIAVDLCKAPPE
jgi:hypothetical protein